MAPRPSTAVDVVVIGAGVGGLVAATELSARHSVAVLESRDRVGGRLRSVGRDGVGVDLGASWFWPGESRVERLIHELGIRTHPHHLTGDALYQDRDGVRRLQGNPIDVASGRFTDGATSLTDALAARLPGGTIRTGTAVELLRVEDAAVEVVHAGGSITASHVVLALPPALAVHRIEIRPALLPPLRGLAEATPVWMGAIAKVVARYDEPFWRDDGLAGAAISHVGPMREIHDLSGPEGTGAALFGFATVEPGGRAPRHGAVLQQLRALFGPRAGEPVELLLADWSAEPDTVPAEHGRSQAYGTYGHPTYQEPWAGGRLHWASTETAPVAPGHIEGAIAAAERAVAAIDAAIDTNDGPPHEEIDHGQPDPA